MSDSFEIWAMRGLVAFLGGALVAFIWREIKSKDAIWKTIGKNRETHERDLAETRKAFTESLDRISGQFRSALDALNQTMAGLTITVGNLNTTMAKEYASKEDLKDAKSEWHSDLKNLKADVKDALEGHAENCPMKFERSGG